MQSQTFRVQKRGNLPEEYEDASAVDLVQARFAIADGASESSFAATWARLLVDEFVRCPVPWGQSWTQWLPPLQERWVAEVGTRPLPWYAEDKFAQGAFATFLGLAITRRRWRAIAIGDCCLFQVRRGRLHRAFPIESADDFSTSPYLLGSRTPPELVHTEREVRADGDWCAGDQFFLLTDALAQWFLREDAMERQPWETLGRYWTPDVNRFKAWIEQLRVEHAIRNDDVTLLAVQV